MGIAFAERLHLLQLRDMITAACWSGIQWGLLLTILVGPILMALIEVGIEGGLRLGLALGLGIWLSDAVIIQLAQWGVSQVGITVLWVRSIGTIGGAVLLYFGAQSVRHRHSVQLGRMAFNRRHAWAYFRKGVLVNVFNPFTFFFWFTMASTEAPRVAPDHAMWFFGGILGTIVVTDSLKVVLAKQLRRWLTLTALRRVKLAGGLVMMAFGVALAVRAWLWQS